MLRRVGSMICMVLVAVFSFVVVGCATTASDDQSRGDDAHKVDQGWRSLDRTNRVIQDTTGVRVMKNTTTLPDSVQQLLVLTHNEIALIIDDAGAAYLWKMDQPLSSRTKLSDEYIRTSVVQRQCHAFCTITTNGRVTFYSLRVGELNAIRKSATSAKERIDPNAFFDWNGENLYSWDGNDVRTWDVATGTVTDRVQLDAVVKGDAWQPVGLIPDQHVAVAHNQSSKFLTIHFDGEPISKVEDAPVLSPWFRFFLSRGWLIIPDPKIVRSERAFGFECSKLGTDDPAMRFEFTDSMLYFRVIDENDVQSSNSHIPIGESRGVAVSPLGKRIVVWQSSGQLSLLDTESAGFRFRCMLPETDKHCQVAKFVQFAPNTASFYVVTTTGELFRFDYESPLGQLLPDYRH